MTTIDLTDATIEIDGETCKLIAFFDEDNETTVDHRAARYILYQHYSDVRPEGTPQTFHRIAVDPDSVTLVTNH